MLRYYLGLRGAEIAAVLGIMPGTVKSTAASGHHLLLAWAQNGWIDHGRLRPLPPQGGMAFAEAW